MDIPRKPRPPKPRDEIADLANAILTFGFILICAAAALLFLAGIVHA